MHRQILSYGPASVLPAFISVAAIYAFTRLLSPAEFGDYTFAFSIVMVVQALFYAMSVAVARLYPVAERAGETAAFRKTAYALFFGLAAAVSACALAQRFVLSASNGFSTLLWVALPVLLLRSAVIVNQNVNRMAGRAARYTVVEGINAGLGFVAGLALVRFVAPTAASVLGGLAIGAGAGALLDGRLLASPFGAGRFDRRLAADLARFSLPLVATSVTSGLMLQADRIVVGGLGGAEMLGVYAAAVSLVERPTTLLCMVIATATYPLAVRALESEGAEAAQRQASRNGMALVALTLPACIGLAMGSRHVAAVLVGPVFRDGVAAVLPLLCVTAFLRGVSVHFLDHAFQLARRPDMMLRIYVPAAVANVACSAALVSFLGFYGAALSALACQLLVIAGQVSLGGRLFPLRLPRIEVAKIGLAVTMMAAAIDLARPPMSWAGLAELILVGVGAYGAALLACDGLGLRSRAWSALRPKPRQPSIYVVAPGGRTATGGMCRMVDYMMAEWEAAGREPALTLVDSTGPYVRWRQPFHFALALGRVLAAGLGGRVVLLHIHAAERGSVLRKAAFIYLAGALGVPCVVHMHGAEFETFYGTAPLLIRRAVTHAFRRAQRFVVLGGAWERYFAETVGIERQRIVVVRNAVPDPTPVPERPARHACRLVFMGALVERKGLGELIEALADPWMTGLSWYLDVAGNGDPAPWRQRASELGIASRITFHGWLDGAGAQRLFAASDVLVLPSRAEGLPMVVIEAMAHGLAVVCTPVGTVDEAVSDGVTGLFVPPRDAEALADALARVIGDADLRRRLGRAGRERFLAEFGIARLNDHMARVFQDALREARPDAALPGVAEEA